MAKGSEATMQYLANIKREGKVKTEALKQASKKALKKLAVFVILFGLASGAGTYGLIKLNEWFAVNELVIKSPVEFSYKTNEPVTIVKRVVAVTISSEQEKVDAIVAEEDDKDLAKYICDKFGVVECKTALAVAKAESGMRCDAVNINTNNTADLGVYQLNTVHLAKGGDWTLANMGNCTSNVDLAYRLVQEQGWGVFVAYTNGNYLAKL